MATPFSQEQPPRIAARRVATIEEALDHAQAIVAEQGAGAVTVSEIARRLGMRAPSLYKYFPSLHAIYDALVGRGNTLVAAHVEQAVSAFEPGLDRLLAFGRAMTRWGLEERGLAPLLYWRPVPGFEPSPESFEPSQALWLSARNDLTAAVRRRELAPAADTDEAMLLFTAVIAGIVSQQIANEPDASFEGGRFTRLLDEALDMFVQHFQAPKTRKASR